MAGYEPHAHSKQSPPCCALQPAGRYPAALLLLVQVVLVGKMSDYQLHTSHHSFCLHDGTGAIDVSRYDNDATEALDAWEDVPVSPEVC